jgi:hypothetical protein
MTRSLTVRLTGPAIRRVRAKARALRMTPSEFVRSTLEGRVDGPGSELSAFELTRRWVGAVRDTRTVSARDARRDLEAWKPDRRG